MYCGLFSSQDVFTVSVGNIPSGATVLIKITYVAELAVEDENIVFNLPGSLAPWSRDQALKDSTQVRFYIEFSFVFCGRNDLC